MTFVQELEKDVHEKLASLDLLKEPELGAIDRSEIVRRLKMALKNELEASEIAAVWIPTTPEVEVKLALARQVGDEAKHYKLIEDHLRQITPRSPAHLPMVCYACPLPPCCCSPFMTMPNLVEPIGPKTIDLSLLEALARQQACVEAILGNIPIGDVHECIQRIMAQEIQKHLDPECTTCDPRGEAGQSW